MAQSSTIVLDEKHQKFVEQLVQAGRYDGTHDVVATGLRLLEEREREAEAFVTELEHEIAMGLASGPAVTMETAEELISQFRKSR